MQKQQYPSNKSNNVFKKDSPLKRPFSNTLMVFYVINVQILPLPLDIFICEEEISRKTFQVIRNVTLFKYIYRLIGKILIPKNNISND